MFLEYWTQQSCARRVLVAEDVHKQQRLAARGVLVRLEPGRDLAQEELVVLHVLEHLDREDAVEPVRATTGVG